MGLGAVVFGLWSATIAKADDQQLVEDYLKGRRASGAVVRPITDDYVGRTFPCTPQKLDPIGKRAS